MAETYPTRRLSEFVAALRLSDVPREVVEDAKSLFADWLGSALAGKDSRPVRALSAVARGERTPRVAILTRPRTRCSN